MLPIVFSHGNSFSASTYSVLFKHLKSRSLDVSAVERYGHDPQYPVTNNWPHLVQQLADFTKPQVERLGQKVFLVGHSLGGFLSIMAAARHPELVRGVLLLDSPLLGGWKANAVGMAKSTQVVGSISPGKVSKQRRFSWSSNEEAMAHFLKKKAFAQWQPEVLQDYIRHGLKDEDGKRVLVFDRAIETAIYNTLPHNMASLLRANPLQCPAAFIGGRDSEEMKQVGMAMTQRITKGRIMMLDGSHLFPMEQPAATAAAIEAALLNLAHITAPQAD